MSRSQAFRARIIKQAGIGAETRENEYRNRLFDNINFSSMSALRVTPLALADPTDTRGMRPPRSNAERVFSRWPQGMWIELDTESIATTSSFFIGAVDYDDYKRHDRVTMDLKALGVMPGLGDQLVQIEARNLVLHCPTPKELAGGIFLNQARITPYVDPTTL